MRLKNGRSVRRTTTSVGTAVQSWLGSGNRNSKRRSHAQTSEQAMRPTCNIRTSTDRQRKSAADSLLILFCFIERPAHFLDLWRPIVDGHGLRVDGERSLVKGQQLVGSSYDQPTVRS